MNILFLMDPLETIKKDKDTSFILMVGAQRKGHKIYFLPSGGIFYENGMSFFNVIEVSPLPGEGEAFLKKGQKTLCQDEVDVIFIRTDPPFDEDYLLNTWLLDLLPERILVVNKPSGIRTVNEKVWVSRFASITPVTLITRDKGLMADFLAAEKEIIVKPTNSYGGQSVFYVKKDDLNANVIFENLTDNSKKEVILQSYVKEAVDGDKRILLLDGKSLGAILRRHTKGEHRNNIFAGGTSLPVEITKRDMQIINVLKPHLQSLGIYFAGIDILGDYLIEVNVTSPTCMREMDGFYNLQLENKVIEFVEELAHHKRKLNG